MRLNFLSVGWLARIPKQSQMQLDAAHNLAYQRACFERAAAGGHTPALHGCLAPSVHLPRGALLVDEIMGRPAQLPGDLNAIASALASLHALPLPDASARPPLLVLGTGGTIAGTASSASDNIGYTAAQVAQVDSKDMRFDIWRTLARRVAHHLAQPQVAGVVITHGTDTLEETAYFLHAVLPAELVNAKPVVLTCAMRPASSLNPDGPQNLKDAVAVALSAGAHGVVVVCAGTVHGALEVQKTHTYRLDAFSSGDAGPLAYVEEGSVRLLKN